MKPVSWDQRLVALMALIWTFGTPWVGLTYIKPEQTILGVWFTVGWFLGIYAFCKMFESLEHIKHQ